ncbi:MAG: helix-turn-helix domain-containing protein [Gammaproteobacteria bacterium]|nr:helix-turn-helix domain-containing protein [Gammaproteobacteria bacterium]MBU0813562.1 helix-turn-helix domain-containing protein [Gammaproteobacteria bacterium]MBU1787680.1 helix-turn-helix domain-containing protein [Gammaproteobacteria bacterium]
MSKNFDTAIKGQLELRRGEWLEIANKAGVSHSWISKFVNGHIPNPGYATLLKLSAALGPLRRTTAKATA